MSEIDLGLTQKSSGGCACGSKDHAEFPELNVQLIPHEVRHATIFGALSGIKPGRGLIIQATHDPVPLLAQLEQREPGVFAVEYLESGPEVWRLQFTRNNG